MLDSINHRTLELFKNRTILGVKTSTFCYLLRSLDFLFDLILSINSIIFQLCGTGLPGLNQY